jgi:hypothetical protein
MMIFMYSLIMIRKKIPHLPLRELGLLPHLRIQLPAFHILQHQNNRVLLLDNLIDINDTGMV